MSKTFLFAGASSAIAQNTAALLKKKNYRIIGISRKATEGIYDHFYTVEKYDSGCFPEISDTLNGIVYFPGTINLKPIGRLSPADFLNDLQINTLGAISFVQAYLPNLKKSGNSSVVFISSVAAGTGLTFHTSVALAKGGLEGFARALAAELAPAIRVNCVAPSLVNTPMGNKFIDTSDKLEQMQKRNPMRKIGEPADVAHAIAYLLSEDSAWVTGQVFAVDGGMGLIKH